MNTIKSEYIKLVTTKGPLICGVLTIALSGAFALLMSWSSGQAGEEVQIGDDLVATALAGFIAFGFLFTMSISALSITNEFRSGIIRTTYLSSPRRVGVILAKAVVVAVYSAVVALLSCVVSLILFNLLLDSKFTKVGYFDSETLKMVLGGVVFSAVTAVIALSLGAILRNSAGTIVILVVWPTVLESLLISATPAKVGEFLGKIMPFSNGISAVSGDEDYGFLASTVWDSWAVFVAFAALLFAIAALITRRRDA